MTGDTALGFHRLFRQQGDRMGILTMTRLAGEWLPVHDRLRSMGTGSQCARQVAMTGDTGRAIRAFDRHANVVHVLAMTLGATDPTLAMHAARHRGLLRAMTGGALSFLLERRR